MSSVSLYCDETSCLLPIHGLVTEFKKCKAGELLQLQQSEDQSVRDNVPELYTGKKWKVAVEACNIDSRIKMSKVMRNIKIGTTGFGYIKRRKRFNDEKQQNCRNFWKKLGKQKVKAFIQKQCKRQSKDSGLRGRVILKEILVGITF